MGQIGSEDFVALSLSGRVMNGASPNLPLWGAATQTTDSPPRT